MELLAAVAGYVIGLAILLVSLYYVIQAAVLAALRRHTLSSTWGVSVVNFPRPERRDGDRIEQEGAPGAG